MAAFLRPGEKRPGAFGVTFDLDAGSTRALPVFNKNERLDLQEQRRRLPAFQHRCLHALLGFGYYAGRCLSSDGTMCMCGSAVMSFLAHCNLQGSQMH